MTQSREGKLLQGFRFRDGGFESLDYVLLCLIGCLGLVWIRLFFIYSVVPAPCAEQIASFGYVSSGWLAGQTVWSMLYATSALATLFCLTVTVTRHDPKNLTITVFRQILLVGFGLLTLTVRSVVIEDPLPPDGFVRVNLSADAVARAPLADRTLLDFESFEQVRRMSRPACLYVKRQQQILPHSYGTYASPDKHEFLWGLIEKGSFINAHMSGQVYLDIPDIDWPLFLDALQRDVTVYKWDGEDWGGALVDRKRDPENINAQGEPDSRK